MQLQFLITAWLVACASAPARPTGNAIGYEPELADDERTQILVLASDHLRRYEQCLAPAALDDLRARLVRWRPDVIAVEQLPATTVEALSHRTDEWAKGQLEGRYQQVLEAGKLARDALQLGAAEARGELATGATGAREVMLLAAAYDYPSAVLRWTSLDPAARGELPSELAAELDTSTRNKDEIYALAMPLASQVGVTRLALIDDFDGEEHWAGHVEQFDREMDASAEAQRVTEAPVIAEYKRRAAEVCRIPGALVRLFEWLNTPDFARPDVAAEWGVWFRTRFPSRLDRARSAAWEARNLGIAAKIRKESSLHAGKRVLVIIGATHKVFLDAYLSQMLDVTIVQLRELHREGDRP